MKKYLILLAAVLLSGCSTWNEAMKNEVVVEPSTQKLRFISFYGPIGIAAKVDAPATAASMPAGKK